MADDLRNATTQSERFYRYFRQEVNDIEEKIENLPQTSAEGGERKSAIDHCYAAVNKLSSEALKASVYLAAHDRKTYGDIITGLRQKLSKTQDAIIGKKKFSFKSGSSRAGASSAESGGNVATESTKEETMVAASEREYATQGAGDGDSKGDDIVPAPFSAESKAVDLEDHDRQHLLVPSYRDSESCSGSIGNVYRCVIHKKMANEVEKGTALASLTVRNAGESLVICGSIHGPVHLTNVTNSIIVVASRQFRMHESRNCDVYLHTFSRPIIEDCKGIRFAPLPEVYQVDGAAKMEDQWREVDDFNWHRIDPSPNWSLLDNESRIKEEVWRDIVSGRPFTGVEEILRAVDILKGTFY